MFCVLFSSEENVFHSQDMFLYVKFVSRIQCSPVSFLSSCAFFIVFVQSPNSSVSAACALVALSLGCLLLYAAGPEENHSISISFSF